VQVIDGHDASAIRGVLEQQRDRMRVVVLRTTKGHGVSFMQGRMEWHYLPLTPEQFRTALAEIEAG